MHTVRGPEPQVVAAALLLAWQVGNLKVTYSVHTQAGADLGGNVKENQVRQAGPAAAPCGLVLAAATQKYETQSASAQPLEQVSG
jgi:hypothetical protein